MKRTAFIILTFFILYSCGKESVQSTSTIPRKHELTSGSEGLSMYDFSNFGIYKGVVINSQDSTATFKFDIYNSGTQPFGLFYTNGMIQDSLIRYSKDNSGLMAVPQKIDTATIPFNAPFYYTYFSSFKLGSGPIVGFNTTAQAGSYTMETQLYHNQTLNAILKEKSNSQVFCFEGSYRGLDSGRIAFVLSSDSVVGIRASVWNPQFFKIMTSRVSNNSFTINQFDDISGNMFIFTGRIENNNCVGTWTKSSDANVTNEFTTRRTL